jgi:ferredoxin
MMIEFYLNGKPVKAVLRGGERLMDLLWRLGIRSVKEGCGTGDCGSCNVLVDGRLVNSCMMLAAQVRDAESSQPRALTSPRNSTSAESIPRLRRVPVRLLHTRNTCHHKIHNGKIP